MEGSAATDGPTPQAPTEPDVSALLQPPIANRREERIQSGVLGDSARCQTAGSAFDERSRPDRAFCRSARSLSLRPSLADARLLRAAEGERVIAPSVTLS